MKSKIRNAVAKHTRRRAKYPRAYRGFGDRLDCERGELLFQDNGASILAVGHLDTVLWARRPKISDKGIAGCPQLDDRLGVAIIAELLPDIVSEPIDILLTDCEEMGASTASDFNMPGRYRWVVEFDREGSDCVLYGYGGGELENTIERCGIDVGYGSYSDIADLTELGCECVNWGCGYHRQHSDQCYAYWAEIERNLASFAIWYREYGERSFPREYKPPVKIVTQYNYFADRWRKVICPHCYCGKNIMADDYCIECGEVLEVSEGV